VSVASSAGVLFIVGLGPGGPDHRTAAAVRAVMDAEVVVGYGPYVDQCADILDPAQEVVRGAMGEEGARADEALDRAAAGARVALVSSGDAGVYGMAARTLARAAALPAPPLVEVVPGMTAAQAAGALLGAPFADDFAVLSLSDLQIDWAIVERRTRTWQLDRVLALLIEARGADTPVALVHDAGREGEAITRATLRTIDPTLVTMRTLLVVAGESTLEVGPWLLALRESVIASEAGA
jgi:precorrin-3B C17-methyltransferase